MAKIINAGELNALIMMNTEAMLRMVEKMPESIVRCKDCTHYDTEAELCRYPKYAMCREKNDFCSKGERKETSE